MKYAKQDAKAWAQAHMKGVWAACPTAFLSHTELDEEGFRRNLRHWFRELEVDGLFVSGKQGEFFSMSVAERKRSFELAAEEAADAGRGATIMSVSDQNMDTVIELARHAQAVGADYIVVHAPLVHFGRDIDHLVHEYYRHIAAQVDIGIAMWSHPDSGYLMSPELCAKVAEIPNVVAIKYSVPREMYARLSRMTQGRLIVSTASEEAWFDNMVELGWQLYLCSIPPLLYQTAGDRRIKEYTELALRGDVERARRVRDSLEPVRQALKRSRPAGTPHAQQKYWLELLGQTGGPARRPVLPLSAGDKARIREAFAASGLKAGAARAAA